MAFYVNLRSRVASIFRPYCLSKQLVKTTGNSYLQSKRFYSGKQDDIVVDKQDGALTLRLNRPERYNAINIKMYNNIIDILKNAANDKEVSVVKMTGTGKYYSSGNDLKDLMELSPSELVQTMKLGGELLEKFVSAFIDFPKMLVAAVNGPAIGISVSILGLFDAVYASEKATFLTPFARTGQSSEGCSSYTFPKIFGPAKATDVLCFGRTLSANEAERALVTKVFAASTFEKDVNGEIQKILSLPINSLVHTKKLMRDPEREILHRVNRNECERLLERWASKDFADAIVKFASKS